eukprot:14280970-Ditylum_brightwellii.AAC.1
MAGKEMLHVMLKYPEIVTNLESIKVTTMPLELWGGIATTFNDNTEDDAYICSAVESFCRVKTDLDTARLQTNSQNLIVDDIKISKISIDKVTQYGLHPPELLKLFVNDKKKVPVSSFPSNIADELFQSCWIDCLQRQ